MTVPLSARVTVPDGVMVREIDSESVILNLNSESYFGLDRVGTRCWNWLVESPTIEDACNRLSEIYEIENERAVKDLSSLTEQLLNGGLIELQDEKAA